MTLAFGAKGLLVLWAGYLAWMDFRQHRLPNGLTLGAAGLGIIYILVRGHSWLGAEPGSAFAAGVLAVLLLAPCLYWGWLGAGDIKMLAAIGFLGGVQILAVTFVIASFLALPFALGSVLKKPASAMNKLALPQGVFFAGGLLLAMLSG